MCPPTQPQMPLVRVENNWMDNFLESIRGKSKPGADIAEGHKSVLLCHLATIAQRTGNMLHTDPVAMKLWSREYEEG